MDMDRRLVSTVPEIPVVRIYTWAGRTISLGYNQDIGRRLRLDLCREDGIDIVRRPTGGREILHGDDICYSVVWPVGVERRVEKARWIFESVNRILSRALRKLGVKACWSRVSGRGVSSGPCFVQIARGEITVGGRKLMASAQRIYDRVVLQQGSMLLTRPSTDITAYLNIDRPRAVKKKLEMLTTWLFDHVDETFSIESIVTHFREEFERFFGSEPGIYSSSPGEHGVFSPAIMNKQ
jgi:lipoate-protein ligase A